VPADESLALPEVIVRPAPAEAPRRSWMAWVAGYAVAAVALFFCYLWVSRTQATQSDGASNALEAWDMLHGNPLLRGWTLTDVSFYTTELPEYMLVEAIRGLSADVIHVAAAVTYTLLVLLAGLVAKGRATGREGLARVLLASGLMIAPQLGLGVHVLLLSPDHTGTGVPLLLIYLVLDRAPRRWWVPPLIGLLLTWVIIGDRLAITVGVVPLVAVFCFRAIRDRAGDRRFDLMVAVWALISVGVAALVVSELARHGSYTTLPLSMHLADSAVMPRNIRLTITAVFSLYGADVLGRPFGVQVLIAALHLAGLGLAGWALFRAIRRFLSWDEPLIQVLAVAIVLNVAAFLFSTLPYTTWDTRQVTAILPFGAVLAGRLLTADLLRFRLAPALTVLLAGYLAALGYGVAQPAVPAHGQDLADWLIAHNLEYGFSVYDEGNVTTLASGGQVQLRVLSWQPSGPVPRIYQSKASWFSAGHYADFVINTAVDGPPSVIPYQVILSAFGVPAHTYQYDGYTIYAWNYNLYSRVGGPPSAAVGNIGTLRRYDLAGAGRGGAALQPAGVPVTSYRWWMGSWMK
jgi:hypothetical protein